MRPVETIPTPDELLLPTPAQIASAHQAAAEERQRGYIGRDGRALIHSLPSVSRRMH
jgi:hypothetical protein